MALKLISKAIPVNRNEVLFSMATFLSVVLIFAAISKMLSFSEFLLAIEKLGFERNATVIGIFIIVLEFTLGVGLLFPTQWNVTGSLTALTLICFTVIATYGKMTGKITSCPCFGRLFDGEVGFYLLLRNTFLTLAAVVLATKSRVNEETYLSELKVHKLAGIILVLINLLFLGRILSSLIL